MIQVAGVFVIWHILRNKISWLSLISRKRCVKVLFDAPPSPAMLPPTAVNSECPQRNNRQGRRFVCWGVTAIYDPMPRQKDDDDAMTQWGEETSTIIKTAVSIIHAKSGFPIDSSSSTPPFCIWLPLPPSLLSTWILFHLLTFVVTAK